MSMGSIKLLGLPRGQKVNVSGVSDPSRSLAFNKTRGPDAKSGQRKMSWTNARKGRPAQGTWFRLGAGLGSDVGLMKV